MTTPNESYTDLARFHNHSRSQTERRRRQSSYQRRVSPETSFRGGPSNDDESLPLLSHRHDDAPDYTAASTPTAVRSARALRRSDHSYYDKPRKHHPHTRTNTLTRRLAQSFRSDRRTWNVSSTGQSTPSLADERLWYDQFTSIDWVQDSIADAARHKELHSRRGIGNRLIAWFDGIQGWILAGLIGLVTACVSYLVAVTEIALFDVKFGYCRSQVFKSRASCCAQGLDCKDWIPWSEALHLSAEYDLSTNFVGFCLFMILMALVSCCLVMTTKNSLPHNASMQTAEQSAQVQETGRRRSSLPQHPPTIFYPAAGSGVAEVRVILSGFIMHGFLGTKVLIVKAIGAVLSVSSGMSVGKEGPLVHMATCVANILSRMFPKYRRNAGKRREALSAGAAAGVAVAFGSPIGGVLFSLEEVSYYFPSKTLFRTFFCSIIAAISLKFLNPYGTNKIVLFRVHYTSDWKFFEMILFILLGCLGGVMGALFIKASRLWTATFRKLPLIKRWPLLEVLLVALVSGILSFWNRYTLLPPAELLFELASECTTLEEARNGLCPTRSQIPGTIKYLALALIVRGFLTVITYGTKIPSGIYIPAMVIGGLLGRIVGHTAQYIIMTYFRNSTLFGTCTVDGNPESCVVPGVYALIAAGSMMCGVTRLSVTLVVILFELTGSLDHVLPFSIAVLFAKWTANALEPLSIYDLFTELSQYPFLDNKTRPVLAGEIGDITRQSRSSRYIDITHSPVVAASVLREKLQHLHRCGEIDGGLPILREGLLVGLIPAPDLEFALDKLENEDQEQCLMSPLIQLQGNEEDGLLGEDPTDFRPYIDPSPIALDEHSSLELAYELFVKLGLRCICVVREGQYYGLVHKKAFVKHAREADHSTRSERGCLDGLRGRFRRKSGKQHD